MTLEEQPDGSYRVCVREDGIEACSYVDSMHCAYGKERYLREAVARQKLQAFEG